MHIFSPKGIQPTSSPGMGIRQFHKAPRLPTRMTNAIIKLECYILCVIKEFKIGLRNHPFTNS